MATISNASGSNGRSLSAAPGTTTISATFGTVSGTAQLTVTSAALASITITPATSKIARGTAQQFVAVGNSSDGNAYDITSSVSWTSSNGAVATISNSPGTEGTATSIGLGSTAIRASGNGKVSNAASLTVVEAVITSISITPANATMYLGAPQQLTATATFEDAQHNSWQQDLTAQVTWKSLKRSVVTVSNAADSRGLATPAGAGTTTISATFDEVNATSTVTISAAKLIGIVITPSNPSVSVGSRIQLAATGTFDDGNSAEVTKTVKWMTSDKTVASVLNNPRKRRAILIGVKAGTATISASLKAVSGKTTATVN